MAAKASSDHKPEAVRRPNRTASRIVAGEAPGRHQNAWKPWKNRLERLYLQYLSARDSVAFRALSFDIEKTVLHER
ncbi:hypothetical protein [Allomesorhizobium camelthorni]|uniref:Uncharacterized protein n=1 Tax=Allomesorhizobium camelthorni TaxID=475069 RepID=A0A6G4WHU7_9HYPH|nr:hypothetical protein [Mesorhizobium camelthorni]NGO53667.1 hypothetical protein [Mesorhizobium camelthorni]